MKRYHKVQKVEKQQHSLPSDVVPNRRQTHFPKSRAHVSLKLKEHKQSIAKLGRQKMDVPEPQYAGH